MINLSEMTKGAQFELIGYESTEKAYRRKLLSMGLTKGTLFTVIGIAPLGDPIEIEIRGFRLSLRKDEAKILKLRKI